MPEGVNDNPLVPLVGHYDNVITLKDVTQWASMSVRSIVNCANHVMVAVLDTHNQFIYFPVGNSEDTDLARKFAESCGFLAIDDSTMYLFTKPGYYGETFFDRKSKYSLGFIFPHNLFIMDYFLGHPGSIRDAFAFQSTRLYKKHADLLPDGPWVWADSAYPLEPWCMTPFKKPCNGWLTKDQKSFNYHLFEIHVHVKHTFAVLKGRFQSL
ncbi:hypothetical protein BDR05DRAFT_978687 [Suillus weaverae]|nr:hypothetical protein BDR05DRAFT_978687 [Suillus weaverae]